MRRIWRAMVLPLAVPKLAEGVCSIGDRGLLFWIVLVRSHFSETDGSC
jgi:hypothetical protein